MLGQEVYLFEQPHAQHWIGSVENIVKGKEPALQQRLKKKSKWEKVKDPSLGKPLIHLYLEGGENSSIFSWIWCFPELDVQKADVYSQGVFL